MSPEQARGDGTRVDGRADLFSLGAVLYECLTGKPAFEGRHLMTLLARLLFEEVPRVREARPDVPRALDDLIAELLAKEPDDRPPNAAAVARALEAMIDVRASLHPPSPETPPSLGLGERRLLSIVAVLPRGKDGGPDPEATQLSRERLAELEDAVSPLGAEVDALANGALFVTLMGSGNATDLAARAARAALALRPLLPAATMALVTGLGESTGHLPVGAIAEQAVELLQAARGHADDAGLPIDETTATLLDARFDVEHGPSGHLLRGERDAAPRPRTLLGRPSPFVGRERELRMIEEMLSASIEESAARAVIVLGAAGVGKSRLLRELFERLRVSRPEVFIEVGRGDSIARGSAFSVLASALRGTAQITAGEPPSVQREKLVEALGKNLSPEARPRVLPFLGEMVGVPLVVEKDERPRLRAARQSAALMAERVREAYLEFLSAEVAVRPRLLVLEDLQWGDAASIKLIDAALRDLGARPFVVLALGRPELRDRFPRLWEERDALGLRLGALPPRAAAELVRRFLGEDVPAEVVFRLVERAEGNAFYLEELVRAVVEGRDAALPETVLGMVEARLLSLDPAARRLLRAGSVFGEVFWEGGVRALLGDEGAGASADLALLEQREVLERHAESRYAGQIEYAFRHALLQEGSYAMLTERDRAVGHKLAGEWLLAAGEQDPKVLATHFGRGGDVHRALGYYVRAAEQALSAGDGDAAVALADEALSLGAKGQRAADLRAIQTDAWTWSNQYVRAHEAAQVALFLAAPGSQSHARGLGGVLSTGLLLRRLDVVGEAMQQLLAVEPEPPALPALSWAFSTAHSILLFTARIEDADAYHRRLEELAHASLDQQPMVRAWVTHVRAYRARFLERDPWAALSLDRESARAFEEAGDMRGLPSAEVHVGLSLMQLGAFEEAEALLAQAMGRTVGESVPELIGECIQVWLLLERGALEEAIQEGMRVAARADGLDEGIIGVDARLAVAEAWLEKGEAGRAAEELEKLEGAVEAVAIVGLWHAALRARVRLAEGRAAEAAEIAGAAIKRSEGIGMVHHHRHSLLLLTYAEALMAMGEEEAARAAIRRAREDVAARAARIGEEKVRGWFWGRIPHHARIAEKARAWLEV
jgi:tetratricopeptide (TPR) repeat protein